MSINHQGQSYRRISIPNIILPLLGIGLLLFEGLSVYSAITDGSILWQALVMGTMGIGIALCFILSPILKHLSGYGSLALSVGYMISVVVYNWQSPGLVIYGLILSLVFFLVPSLVLTFSLSPANQVRLGGAMEMSLDRAGTIGIIGLVVVVLIVLFGLFSLGFST